MRRSRMRFFSRILTAKDLPESTWRAYLTFPKFPSPRVLPSSYLPNRIPLLGAALGDTPPFAAGCLSRPLASSTIPSPRIPVSDHSKTF
nr:hypothetical protein Iba_chr13aCG1230 [Ipomoea batatas]